MISAENQIAYNNIESRFPNHVFYFNLDLKHLILAKFPNHVFFYQFCCIQTNM